MSKEKLDVLAAEEFDMEVQGNRVERCDGSCYYDCLYVTIDGKDYCTCLFNMFA